MSVQDLSIWHDRRTAGNAYRGGGHLSFQQLHRATDHAEASVSVAGAAPRPNREVLKRGAERMASRNLSKRLERLEERMLPAGEPLILQIQFVSPDGTVEDGP